MIERAEADVKRADPTSVLALTTDRAFLLWRGRGRAASGRGSQGKADRGSDGCGIAGVGRRTNQNKYRTKKNVHALFFFVLDLGANVIKGVAQ